jgi:hypothetical protein
VNIKYSGIDQVLAALREGKPVIISDAEDRENEGDAIIAGPVRDSRVGGLDGALHLWVSLRANERRPSKPT